MGDTGSWLGGQLGLLTEASVDGLPVCSGLPHSMVASEQLDFLFTASILVNREVAVLLFLA